MNSYEWSWISRGLTDASKRGSSASVVMVTARGSIDTAVEGQFDRPTDVVVDPQGNLYVVDFGHDRIQKFTPLP